MVAHTTRTIPYGATHLTDPTFMPLPDADLFWDSYVVSRPGLQEATDLTLGAWAHLVADRCYNGAVRRVIANKDLPHGDELRIRKQADFDAFGRMLTITSVPHETDELLRQAQAFPQYPLAQVMYWLLSMLQKQLLIKIVRNTLLRSPIGISLMRPFLLRRLRRLIRLLLLSCKSELRGFYNYPW